jgi:tetratricopeptide (TPR) repeat protein
MSDAWNLKAQAHYHALRDAEADTAWRRSLDAARRNGSRTAEAQAQMNLALLAQEIGNPAAARDMLVETLAVVEQIGLQRHAAHARGSLGRALQALDRPTEARSAYVSARAELGEIGDLRAAAMVDVNLAKLDLEEGALDTARQRFVAALDAFRHVRYAVGERLAVQGLAHVARTSGDFDTARRLYLELLALQEETGAAGAVLAATWIDLGRVARSPGEADAAFAEAIRLGDACGDAEIQGGARIERAVVALEQGRIDDARTWLDEARLLVSGVALYWFHLAEALVAACVGDPARAIERVRLAEAHTPRFTAERRRSDDIMRARLERRLGFTLPSARPPR